MSISELRAVKSLSVIYNDPVFGTATAEVMTVASVRSINATAAEFLSPIDGRGLRVWNGEAHMFTKSWNASVCAADITCSSFSVSARVAAGLVDSASSALTSAGFSLPTSLASPLERSNDRRQLASSSGRRADFTCW
jgi:hypothetical protein